MSVLNIGTRREVCWDEYLMETAEGVSVKMHKPEYRGIAMTCDKPWEGNVSGYFVLMPDEGKYRLYYRGFHWDVVDGDELVCNDPSICYAESKDGKTFTRVNVGEYAYWGSKENNIILDCIRDNIFFFKDTNPDCPPDAKYKALAEHDIGQGSNQTLCWFKSADGVHFELQGVLADDGAYDSLNVCFWDEATAQYYLFYRGLHGKEAVDGKWMQQEEAPMHDDVVRDVRVKTSGDFVHWSESRMLDYGPDADDYELYTNNVQQYYRAKHMQIGFPLRYVDRYTDHGNFHRLTDWKHRQGYIRRFGRTGTAMTDSLIMTSRDGYHFRRTDEAFLPSGAENGKNWYYGDCGNCYGMAETKSEIPGAPNEISLYFERDVRMDSVKLTRYAVRLDGFFSWHCDYKPGKVVTKPITFGGNSLSINFATSAIGYVQIRILDVDGTPLEGYDSGKLFGDSVDRTVDFEKKLSDLAGKEVRLDISMSDAELYAFKFEEIPAII